MNSSTRRLALRAAAKAALSVSLLGCGGTVVTEGAPGDAGADTRKHDDAAAFEADTVSDSGTFDGDATTADEGAQKTGALACGASSVPPDAAVDDGTFACCRTFVKGVTGDAGDFEFPDATAQKPEVIACCAVIVERLDHDNESNFSSDYDSVGRNVEACCDVTLGHMHFSRACDPWGPPVPPEMPEALRDLEEVA